MPQTRLATLRYQALDHCFSDQTRHYFIEDLIEAVNNTLENNDQKPVSRRTVYNDIRDMESNHDWNVLFEEHAYIDGRRYYRYENPQYSIWKNDLDEHQLEQMKSLMLLLQQFHGLPQFERVQEVIQQLEEKYKFKLQSPESVIAFDTNEYVAGVEHLSLLFEAIVNKQPLRITYQPYGKDAYEKVVHPYFIKQYNNRWFLFGYSKDGLYENIINMPFDRIQSIAREAIPFVENTLCNFDEFFDDIIGVTQTHGELQTVVLHVAPARLPYILSKPLHPSQRIRHEAEGIVVLEVIPNKELYQLLLSFGPDIKVLEPVEIQQQMEEFIQKMAENYKNIDVVQKDCTTK